MKKILPIIMLTFILSTMILFILPDTKVYADNSTAGSVLNTIGNGDTSSVETGTLTNMAKQILGIIQIASAIAAVILIAVFGFRFILGSAQEKSDYMKSFIPLIVGVVIVFSASSIAKLIFNVANANGTQNSSAIYTSSQKVA